MKEIGKYRLYQVGLSKNILMAKAAKIASRFFIFGRMLPLLLVFFSSFAPAHAAGTISLTPNSNGGGNLPSGYDRINFTLPDGDWVKDIVLPTQPTSNAMVNIVREALIYLVTDPDMAVMR